MNLTAIAKAYTDCINLEERTRKESPDLSDELSVLRSDLHALLMEALQDAHIPYTDRADAARIAFEIVQGKPLLTR